MHSGLPDCCVHHLFVQQAAATPDKVAVSCHGQTLTYGELDVWSAELAHQIIELGLGPGLVVGLLAERSPSLIAGLLGILRAGATYLPLDPSYPTARLEYMIRAGDAGLLLTEDALALGLPSVACPRLKLANGVANSVKSFASYAALPDVPVSTSAYIIFTSGSTGLPKGVEVSHLALMNLLLAMQKTPGIAPDDVLLAVTSICFDISALELFLPLIAGARIELASTEDAGDPMLLRERVHDSGATMMQATPATWRMLLESGWTGSPSLKVLCGGEALVPGLAVQLLQSAGSVWNMYGPTETTIWSSCARVRRGEPVSLGEPIANTELYLLDADQALVSSDVVGELYIGGTGLAKGYRGQPELTAAQFPLVLLSGGEVQRLYRTGDRVKRLPDGSLIFVGRVDRQIKLNGFRIELGEIEEVLNSVAGVAQSVAIKSHHAVRGEILGAFAVPKSGFRLEVEELRAELGRSLPQYMQPSALGVLSEMPLTLNGKIDHARLSVLVTSEHLEDTERPHRGMEQRLAGVWCALLGVSTAGRHDNFFDAGGHSLLAVSFVSRVNQTLHQTLTVTSFLQAPTIAKFARVAEGDAGPQTLLLKRGVKDGKQMLWIGAEPWLPRLLPHLSNDLSLYTLTLDPTDRTTSGSSCTMEWMASELLRRIREVQAAGPYLLGGFCLSGLLAYEIAQQMQQAGEEVGLLVLVDLYAPGRGPRWTRMQRVMSRIRREALNASSFSRLGPRRGLEVLKQRFHASQDRRRFTRAGNIEQPRELQHALYGAEISYEVKPFRGRVLFFESAEEWTRSQRTSRSWAGLISDLEVSRYPGGHENILAEPHLRLAAEVLQRAIRRVAGAEATASYAAAELEVVAHGYHHGRG